MKIVARSGIVVLLAVAALSAAGCVKSKMLVVVNPDGSGNIAVRSLMSPETASMIGSMAEGLASSLGGTGQVAKAEDPFFKEDELREAAAKFGEGVTYVKGTKVSESGWQGSAAVYAFADVTKLRIPLESKMDGQMGGGDEGAEAKPGKLVTFEFAGGPTKKLRIVVPQDEEKAAAAPAAADAAAAPDAQAEALGNAMGQAMMAPMLQMMKGMEMGVAVQVKGKVLKNTGLHREENESRIVILDLNMDKMQTSTNFAAIFQKSQGADDMPTRELLGMPGFRFETNTAVEIEFQ